MLLRCDHVHLIAEDPERTVAWYRQVLGARITFEGRFRGSRVTYLDMAGMTFIVFGALEGEPAPVRAAEGARYGVDHFGFAVDDLDRTIAGIQAAGGVVREGPLQVRPGLRIAYIDGPDRIRIELSQRDA